MGETCYTVAEFKPKKEIIMDKKEPLLARPLVVTLLAILCNALWGSAIPFINLGYRLFGVASGETATQIFFAGCRFFRRRPADDCANQPDPAPSCAPEGVQRAYGI